MTSLKYVYPKIFPTIQATKETNAFPFPYHRESIFLSSVISARFSSNTDKEMSAIEKKVKNTDEQSFMIVMNSSEGEIYDKLKFCAVNNIPRKITNILEVLKLEAQVPDFQMCIRDRDWCAMS